MKKLFCGLAALGLAISGALGVAGAAAGTAIEATGETAADCHVGQVRPAVLTITRVQPS